MSALGDRSGDIVIHILGVVADYYGVSPYAMIVDRCHRPEIVWPRHVSMALARERTYLRLTQIAQMFMRTHSTVIHAVRSVRDTCDVSQQRRYELGQIKARLP